MRGSGLPHLPWRLVALSLAIWMAVGGVNPSQSASAQVPQPSRAVAPIVVTIDKPSDRESYPANGFVPISAKAASAKRISSMEVWVDGALIDQKPPLGFQNRYSAHFSWQPGSKGEHVVVVRAVDESGAFADSGAVRITATGPVNARLLLKAGDGESPRAIAERLKVPADQVASLNPGLDLNQPLPPGFALFAPPSAGPGRAVSSSPAAQVGSARPAAPAGSERAAPSTVLPPSTLSLIDGKLVTAAGIERVYYYVSLGDGPWRRIPEDPNSYVNPLSLDELRAWEKTASPGIADRRAFDVAGKLGDLRA